MHNRFFVIRRVTASCATCGGTISTLINEMFAPRVGHSKGTSKTATAPFGSAARTNDSPELHLSAVRAARRREGLGTLRRGGDAKADFRQRASEDGHARRLFDDVEDGRVRRFERRPGETSAILHQVQRDRVRRRARAPRLGAFHGELGASRASACES